MTRARGRRMSMYVSARPVRRGPAAARSSPRIVSALKANRLVPRVDGRMSPPRRLRSPLRAAAALTRLLVASATEKEEGSRDTGCRVRPDEGVPPGPEPEPGPEPAAADSSSSRDGADEAARRAALERQKEERRAEEVRRKQQRRK
eukprot:COSAG01_NODE_717_length_14076_cov_20.354225_9_plen_146_part_00